MRRIGLVLITTVFTISLFCPLGNESKAATLNCDQALTVIKTQLKDLFANYTAQYTKEKVLSVVVTRVNDAKYGLYVYTSATGKSVDTITWTGNFDGKTIAPFSLDRVGTGNKVPKTECKNFPAVTKPTVQAQQSAKQIAAATKKAAQAELARIKKIAATKLTKPMGFVPAGADPLAGKLYCTAIKDEINSYYPKANEIGESAYTFYVKGIRLESTKTVKGFGVSDAFVFYKMKAGQPDSAIKFDRWRWIPAKGTKPGYYKKSVSGGKYKPAQVKILTADYMGACIPSEANVPAGSSYQVQK